MRLPLTNMPNKSLGQHWLNDARTLETICNFADIKAGDTVLEIGPGQGALTRVLLEKSAIVHAIEFDPALAQELVKQGISQNLIIEHADILQFDLETLPKYYKVAANVPYYITSAIVRKLLEAKNPPKSATLLVQKEVAERIAAAPGDMSLLSVSAQFYANVVLGEIVKAEKFIPPPKVDSQVIKLDYTGAKFDDIDAKDFFRVVKAGFGERRKKLRSSLSGGLQLPKNEIDELLKKSEISADARAQELSLENWHKLALLFQS